MITHEGPFVPNLCEVKLHPMPSAKAALCPVCVGRGKVGSDPSCPNDPSICQCKGLHSDQAGRKPCHGCDGKGWVVI